MKITSIRLDRMRLPLDPPFEAAWDPVPRRHFDATLVRVGTDAGITGYGSGDTMDGFGAFADLFVGTDPLQIANQVRVLTRDRQLSRRPVLAAGGGPVGHHRQGVRSARGHAVRRSAGWTEQRRDFFLSEPVRIDAGGCVRVPAAAGLGASIDEDAVSRWALDSSEYGSARRAEQL